MPRYRNSEDERCDQCRYWVLAEQWDAETELERHADDRRGSCHRHAPQPIVGDSMYYLLYGIALLIPRNSPEDFFENWEEAALGEAVWPVTWGEGWCGEYERGEGGIASANPEEKGDAEGEGSKEAGSKEG